MDVLLDRDTKGLYRAAKAGAVHNVVGIDIPFPPPPHPDLVLDSFGPEGQPDVLVDRILSALPARPR
jgi:adenylylsulfate kinase